MLGLPSERVPTCVSLIAINTGPGRLLIVTFPVHRGANGCFIFCLCPIRGPLSFGGHYAQNLSIYISRISVSHWILPALSSNECHCSKGRPSHMRLADDLAECSSQCEGDKSQKCGGPWRLSVYDIENRGINYVQGSYEGCFADDGASRRALRGRDGNINQIMTPEFCVGYCFVHGYKYAGAQSKNQCYCGDQIQGEVTTDCNAPCVGDSRLRCGNSWKSDIYRTSINDELTPEFVGCFIDSKDRLFSSYYQFFLRETNSPRRCLNICSILGFKYAGVEVGNECYCGNKRPDPKKETNENQCLRQCSNGKDGGCGGAWRVAVYMSSPCSENTCCKA